MCDTTAVLKVSSACIQGDKDITVTLSLAKIAGEATTEIQFVCAHAREREREVEH